MPHVIEHVEEDNGFIPLGFAPSAPDDGFIPLGFGGGPPQQRYVPENNSIVTLPAGSSESLASRESKEVIDGQKGFYGTTMMGELLGATGGLAEVADFKKLLGGLESALVNLIAGGSRELVILGLNVKPGIPFTTKSGEVITIPAITPALDLFIQEHPEASKRFSAKMLELQNANEDFLIRNGLMFGPDDEPTVLGILLSQTGPTGFAIGLSVLLRNPAVAALFFGGMQQVAGFEEALEAGKDPRTASEIGSVQGLIEGGISFIGLGIITNAIKKKGASIAAAIATGFITEGVEEGVTELLIIGVQNATGVRDMTTREVFLAVFQAVFYGALAGGGTTGAVATVQKIAGGSLSQGDAERVARAVAAVVSDEAPGIADHVIADIDTELEIDKDIATGKPVTKAAKSTMEQQQKLVKILQMVNDQLPIDIQAEIDEQFPELRIQREHAKLKEADVQKAETLERNVLREALVELDTEMQIAEQEGDEEAIGKIAERINEVQQVAVSTESLRETVQELQDEGLFVADSPLLGEALEAIDDVLKPLRAGVRLGQAAQVKQGQDLQKALKKIINGLAKDDVIGPDTASRLKDKLGEATSIKTAESVRRDIINQARKAAIRKFRNERLVSIKKKIDAIADTKKRGVLDPDSQNAVESMDKMRIGRNKAAKVKAPKVEEQTDEQKALVVEFRITQIEQYTLKETKRIQKEMGQGIPTEAVILQVRYLDILNEKTKATPESVAKFEDDLDAFIATGKGKATAADAKDNALMQKTRENLSSSKVKDPRIDIDNFLVVETEKSFNFFLATHNLILRLLGLKGTVFDVFREDVSWRNLKQVAMEKVLGLANEVSPDGDGKKYLLELSADGHFTSNVIDVSRKGHTAESRGKQPGRVKWTRGQLLSAAMLLQEKSIEEQIRNPDGKMAWTDDFIALINERLTDQDRDFIDGLFEIYRESYERFNEVYREVYNRDLTFVEFYSHISREGKDGQDESAHTETMLIDILNTEGSGESLIFGPKQPSESITRVDASSEIKIVNVIDVFRNYTYDVEHFIAFAKKLRLQDKLLRDKKFLADMRDKLTDDGFENFLFHIKISARSNKDGKRMERFLDEYFEFFRGIFFKKTLLANPKIGLGQTVTAIAAMGEMPTENFLSGARSYLEDPVKWGKILDTHPTFAKREKNFSPEIDQVGEFGDILHFLNLPARKGDGFAVRVSGTAIVIYQMEVKGLSQDDAVDVAAEFIEESQQSTLPTMRTLAQKSDDPLVRSMTMFTSSPVAMFNVSMAAIIKYKQADTSTPKKKAAERAKLNKILAIQNLYIPTLYMVITGKAVSVVAGGSLGGVPVIGGLLQIIALILINVYREEDERVYTKGIVGEISLFKAVDDILAAGNRLTKDGLSMADYLDITVPIVELAGRGFPAGNIRNIGEGAIELFDTDDPIAAGLQMLDYGEAAIERTKKRLGLNSSGDSGRIESQPARGALRE